MVEKELSKKLSWFLLSLLALTVLLLLGSLFSYVRADPSPETYSEFSRIFDASLIFSKKIYGQNYPWPVLDPGRSMLEALTFLHPQPSLFIYRAWTALLWFVMTLLFSFFLAKRFHNLNRQTFWLIVLFGFLFIFQGPIYFHLLVAPIIVLALYHRTNYWQTTLAVLLASVWVGLCRINWFPLPGALAALLFLIEHPVQLLPPRRYLAKPISWVAGGSSIAVITYVLYGTINGTPLLALNPAFRYSFWPERWFPNELYPLGVLPGVILVSLPLSLYLFAWFAANYRSIAILRIKLIAVILGVFALGGLIVSIRSGGTFDLHNMDGYLVLLLVLALHVYFGSFTLEDDVNPRPALTGVSAIVMTLAVLAIPIIYNSMFNFSIPSETSDPLNYAEVQEVIDMNSVDGKPVLFLDHRHLLAFDFLDVPLYLPYEKIYLMEMLMAHQYPYMKEFEQKLREHEFSVIVSDGQNFALSESILAPEENNWSNYVKRWILKYYERVYRQGKLWIWIPRD